MADPSPRISPTAFLTSLTTLFTSTHDQNHGSVFITQKPLLNSSTSQILIRATNGAAVPKKHQLDTATKAKKAASKDSKKVKISTVIEAEEVEEFFGKLAECCKGGMVGLRKRDRRKAKGKKGKGAGGKGEGKKAA